VLRSTAVVAPAPDGGGAGLALVVGFGAAIGVSIVQLG
jgi:hypothetical protein